MVLPSRAPCDWIVAQNLDIAVAHFTGALEQTHPGVLNRLRNDAKSEIDTWSDLDVVLSEDNDPKLARSDCSTAGLYDYYARPPRLIIAHSASHQRNAFTILHELAHHLQRTDGNWLSLVLSDLSAAQSNRLEHRLCDEFASEILLPRADLAPALTNTTVTAGLVRDLVPRFGASRSAVLFRAVQYLPAGTAAVIVNPSNEVVFNTARGDDVAPPPRGSALDSELLTRARERPSDQVSGSIDFHYRTGTARLGLTATAAGDRSGYVFVLAAQNNQYGRRPAWETATTDCECGNEFTPADAAGNCPRCAKPLCPDCRTCPCTTAKATVCTECFTILSAKESGQRLTKHQECF